MAIMVECNSCGKQYSAVPAMAGKRVKCKQCGNVFTIPNFNETGEPDLDQQDDLSALTALADLERSRSGEPSPGYGRGGGASASRAGTVVSGQGIRGGEGLAKSAMARTGLEQEIGLATPEEFGRANLRFNYPFSKEVDQYLPWVLVIGGLAIAAAASVRMDPLVEQPKEPGAAWIPWTRLAVMVVMYLLLVGPLAIRGMRMASKALRFQLPRNSTLRGYACFMPGFALAVLMFMASGGQLFGLILGALLGLMLSFGAVHLLYRLRTNEMPMTATYAGVMFGVGSIIGLGIVIGLNLLLSSVMVATKKADQLAASPLAAGLSWPKTETPSVKPKAKPATAHASPTTAPSGSDAVAGSMVQE